MKKKIIRLFFLILINSLFFCCCVKKDERKNIAFSFSDSKNVVKEAGTPYPRLGMWWLDAYNASNLEMSKYDLLLQSFNEESVLINKYKEVKKINPNQINFKPLSPSERQLFMEDWETGEKYPNPEISGLPSDFFLLQTGANLVESIDEFTTYLKLNRLKDEKKQSLFHLEGEVAIGDYESAKIIAIDWENNILEVERGYVRSGSTHEVGEIVASHIRFWPGSWIMNVTSACKRRTISGCVEPVNWIEYYFKLIQGDLQNIYRHSTDNHDLISTDIKYAGYAIDRFEDKESWLKWVKVG